MVFALDELHESLLLATRPILGGLSASLSMPVTVCNPGRDVLTTLYHSTDGPTVRW